MTPEDEGPSGAGGGSGSSQVPTPEPGAGTAPRRAKAAGTGAGDMGGLAFQLAATIFAFLFIGRWLDGRLGTNPWLTMLFVFVGAGASFYSMYRKLTAAQKRAREERTRGRS